MTRHWILSGSDTDRRTTVEAAEGYDITESPIVELVPRRSGSPRHPNLVHRSGRTTCRSAFCIQYSIPGTPRYSRATQWPGGSSGARKGEKFVFWRRAGPPGGVNSDTVPCSAMVGRLISFFRVGASVDIVWRTAVEADGLIFGRTSLPRFIFSRWVDLLVS